MAEPSGQHLPHGSVIVGAFHRLDLELAVIAALWFSILVDDHGTNGLHTAGIGNIVSFHPADPLQSDQRADLVHGADGAELFPLDLFLILGQHQFRILLCQFHQTLFLAFLRHHQFYLLASL